MYLVVTIEGEKQLSRVLQASAENVKDWTGAFTKITDNLLEVFTNEVFNTEGEAIDEYWAPLSPAYAKQKEKRYPGQGLLQGKGLDGGMRGSFTRSIDTTSAKIWNTVEYFKYHQSNQPRSRLPRRVMMKLNQNMKENIVRAFNEQLQETLTT